MRLILEWIITALLMGAFTRINACGISNGVSMCRDSEATLIVSVAPAASPVLPANVTDSADAKIDSPRTKTTDSEFTAANELNGAGRNVENVSVPSFSAEKLSETLRIVPTASESVEIIDTGKDSNEAKLLGMPEDTSSYKVAETDKLDVDFGSTAADESSIEFDIRSLVDVSVTMDDSMSELYQQDENDGDGENEDSFRILLTTNATESSVIVSDKVPDVVDPPAIPNSILFQSDFLSLPSRVSLGVTAQRAVWPTVSFIVWLLGAVLVTGICVSVRRNRTEMFLRSQGIPPEVGQFGRQRMMVQVIPIGGGTPYPSGMPQPSTPSWAQV